MPQSDRRTSKMASEVTKRMTIFLGRDPASACAIAGVPHGSPADHQLAFECGHRPHQFQGDVCQNWVFIRCQQCVRGTVQQPSQGSDSEVQAGILNILEKASEERSMGQSHRVETKHSSRKVSVIGNSKRMFGRNE